jgi:acyl-CoA synthetase (NDP forming)
MGEIGMHKMFYPESVMIYGVSASPTNLGRYTAENLERFGFKGAVYMVGREGGKLNGREIYRHIEDIETVPDLAVFLIPARAIPDVLERCGRKGIPYAVIQSAGFSEFTEEGHRLEEQLLEISRKWNIRFMGPNCIGTINLDHGMVLPFVPMYPDAMMKGPVSIISQSGGFVIDAIRILTLENIGFNKAISIGNKLNLNECDYLSYFMSDPETQIIGMYLENLTDGRRLMELAQQADKPVVILKANRSATSQEIAQFHTTALAGDDEVASAAMKQAGIHRAETLQDMTDAFKIFSLPLIRGRKIGVVCRSGGQAVLLADAVHHHGFELARFSDQVFDYVRKEVRAGVIRMTNPLDLGDVYDIRFYIRIIEKVLQEPDVDGLVFGHTYMHGINIPPTQELIRQAKALSDRYDKPVVFFMIAGKKYFFMLKETESFPIFADPEQAMESLALSYRHFSNRSTVRSDSPAAPLPPAAGRTAGSAHRPGFMDPGEVFRLLKSSGLPVADFALVESMTAAVSAAEEIGYPVALKTASPNILHKTEAKGVILNISGPQPLRDACREMKADVYLVQKMAGPGQEVIIGGRRDREFGPVILFGLGGVFTEVLRDVALRVCPIDLAQALAMIEETKGARILKGFRGQAAADIGALADCLVKVSRLLVATPEIGNLDMNPLLVFEKNRGCLAVDAKIERVQPFVTAP